MAELSSLSRAGLPQINFQPINPSSYIQEPPAPLPADTQQASAALGHAAVLGAISKSIAELPETFEKAYQVSQKRGITNRENTAKLAGLQLQSDILSGGLSDDKKKALAGATIGPDGSMQFKIEDPRETEAKIRAYDNRGVSQGVRDYKSLKDQFDHGTTAPLPAGAVPLGQEGEVLGKGTTYGYVGDQYGGPKAKASRISAIGTPLDENSLATSPDVTEKLKAAGYKRGDMVTLHTSAGEVTRRWDDSTATDAEARDLGLNPLRGRFDFHATADGKPSPYDGVKVLGVAPKGGAAPISSNGEQLIPDGNGGFNVRNAVETRDGAQPLVGSGGPGAPAVDPAIRQQIGQNVDRAAQGLQMADLSNVLSAGNEAGPVPSAGPALDKMLAAAPRPTLGHDPQSGAVIYSPTPDSVMSVTPSGDKLVTRTPAIAAAEAKQPKVFSTPEELISEAESHGLTPEKIERTAGGYTASSYLTKPKLSPSEIALDKQVLARGGNPVGMSLEEKGNFLEKQVPLKPAEKLSAIRDLRQAHTENPSTILMYGKGQMPGLDTVFGKLEDIRKDSKDFESLSPQQGRTLLFQFAKFNDPTSAVLLGEYKAAADAVGVLDKFENMLNKIATGAQVNSKQAKDLYNVVKVTHDRVQQDYVANAAELAAEAKALGIPARRVGISAQAERLLNQPQGAAPGTVSAQGAAGGSASGAAPGAAPAPAVANKLEETKAWLNSPAAAADPVKAEKVKAALRSQGLIP